MDRHSQDLEFPDWQPQFLATLLEEDPQKLQECVLKAEEAIYARSQALLNLPNVEAEKLAIKNAMRALRVIQVEKLDYPKWTGWNK